MLGLLGRTPLDEKRNEYTPAGERQVLNHELKW